MIELTDERRDALTELLNIGFGRSIASLAEMLGIYIKISVPSIRVVSPDETADILSAADEGQTEVTLIQQSRVIIFWYTRIELRSCFKVR